MSPASGPNRQSTQIGVDELFTQYLGVVALLPDPSARWGVLLASAFWQALTPEIQGEIANHKTHHHPDPSTITSKEAQVVSL